MIDYNLFENYKAYLFDFDGVLYNTSKANFAAYTHCFEQLGFKWSDEEFSETDGMELKQILQHLSIELNPDDYSKLKKLKAQVYPEYFNLIERNGSLFDFAWEQKNNDKIITITSSAQLINIHNILKYFKDFELFDAIFARDHVENPKPHPEVYEKCLDHLSLNSQDCIVFEDTPIGLESAQSAGLKTIHVDTFINEP